jgi:hypothetical protein
LGHGVCHFTARINFTRGFAQPKLLVERLANLGWFTELDGLCCRPMKVVNRAVFAATAFFCAGATPLIWGDARQNPYDAIVERNPFGIKPPPPPAPDVPVAPVVPLAKVVLTGITSVFGPPRALFEVTEQETGKTPNIKKPILREGERDGAIEVLSIDLAKNEVLIKNGTVETNVAFEVAKATGAPTTLPVAATGVPPAPVPVNYANPAMHNAAAPAAVAGGGTPTIIGGNNPGRNGSGVTTYGAADKMLPTRQVRSDGTPGQTPMGIEMLREAARARGLPTPSPQPLQPGTPYVQQPGQLR